MTAGGQPACAPAPTLAAPDRYDDGIAQALVALLGRRRLMQAAAGGVATLLLAACGSNGQGSTAASSTGSAAASTSSGASASAASTASGSSSTAATSSAASASAASTAASSATASGSAASTASATSSGSASAAASGQEPWVYVFNVGSKDVSIIDSATNKVLSTKSLGASVRWLSNEQTYWDGAHIWTYDFPDNKLQAIAIDPKAMKVAQTIDTGTTGPGHSLMLTPDKSTAFLNAGGSNVVNVIDVKSGQVADKIETGKFP